MKIIQALVVRVDNFTFANCQPVTKEINCDGATVIGMAWMEPVYNMGVLQEWLRSLETDKPTPDSIRVIMVQTRNPETHVYYICVDDAATPATFTDLCNACCGDTPPAPAFTMPVPIVEDCQCADEDGNYTWNFPLPLNPNGLAIKITGYSFNGAYGVPDPPASFANAAAVQTWLAANWNGYGTWTQAGGVQKLVSTTVKCMGLTFDLVPATYCYALPAVGTKTVATLVVQTNATGPVTVEVPLPGGPVTYSNATGGALIYVLQQLLPGTFSINAGSPNKIQYTGLQVPVKFLDADGADVASWTAGECLNEFRFAIPDNPVPDNYHITGDTFDGVAGTPAVPGAGWATTGDMLTWLTTNWSAYGTWTIDGTDLVLNSHDVADAELTIDLV